MCKTRWGREKTHTKKTRSPSPLHYFPTQKRPAAEASLSLSSVRSSEHEPLQGRSFCTTGKCVQLDVHLSRSLSRLFYSSFSSPTARLLRSNACTKITMTAPALFTDKLPSQARVRQQRDWPTNWHGPLCLCLSVRLATPSTTRVFTHHATPAFTFDPVTNGPRLDGK